MSQKQLPAGVDWSDADDGDFANVARFIQLVVTMPRGREHTMVPCEDLRAVVRELQRLYAFAAAHPAEGR